MKSSKQRTFFQLFYKMIFHKESILFVTSNHQITNIVFPIFSTNFQQLKKKANFSLVQNQEKPCFGPIKGLFSFSTAEAEKNLWKKLGKTNLVV